jgi:hypothetical protein
MARRFVSKHSARTLPESCGQDNQGNIAKILKCTRRGMNQESDHNKHNEVGQRGHQPLEQTAKQGEQS